MQNVKDLHNFIFDQAQIEGNKIKRVSIDRKDNGWVFSITTKDGGWDSKDFVVDEIGILSDLLARLASGFEMEYSTELERQRVEEVKAYEALEESRC